MMAVVVEGPKGRVYVPPDDAMEELAQKASPQWRPDLEFAHNSRHFTPWAYGLDNFGLLFSNRQLAVLDTFSDLITDVLRVVKADAILAGLPDDGVGIDAGGSGASAYAGAVALLLAFAVNRVVDRHSTIATWDSSPSKLQLRNTFARQALAMTWDFGEGNPFCDSSGTWNSSVDFVAKAIGFLPARQNGHATQADAQTQNVSMGKVVSTDPPYYDNVPYADLSDFFYVWMRHSLRDVFPNIFSTIGVPKAEELVADPFRHNGKQEADYFFLMGMTKAIQNFANQAHPAFPIAIYYAFKQSETDNEAGTTSTGWETFLAALLSAGLTISGTWPMRTELGNRMRSSESNALASSIVLVCNKRPIDAPTVSRREFLRELNNVLPNALDEMVRGSGEDRSPVAPVDLSQAVIGPGMAVFSKYTAVLEANGDQMTVRTALQLINRFLTEDDFDHDTQFCLHWFEQHGWREGAYGEADVLARAKGTSVNGLEIAGVIESSGGKVRILKYEDYRPDWDPRTDKRLPMWEALHHLIRLLRHGGESEAGRVLAVVRDPAEPIRQLAYRLYTLCERAGAAEDARAYNELVNSWSAIEAAAGTIPPPPAGQMDLFGGGSKP
jgi:putative DNA methylase